MKKKMGRPVKINRDDFEKLCAIMCTEEEIAGFFDCHIDTVNNFCKREYNETFSDVYKRKSAKGKISLRRNQWVLSEKNTAMAIWLGKQWLGQKEPEQHIEQTIPVQINLDGLLKNKENTLNEHRCI